MVLRRFLVAPPKVFGFASLGMTMGLAGVAGPPTGRAGKSKIINQKFAIIKYLKQVEVWSAWSKFQISSTKFQIISKNKNPKLRRSFKP
jgi:hypothetical protein